MKPLLAIASPPDSPAPTPAPEPPAQPSRRRYHRLLGGLTDIRQQNPFYIVAVAVLGAMLINVFFYFVGFADDTVWGFALGVSIAFAMWLSMAYLNAWLAERVDWLQAPWRAFATALASNVVVGTLALGTVYFVFFVVLGDETAHAWLRRQRFGNYFGSILIGLFITAVYQGAWFVKLWKESLVEGERLKTASISAKYETLNAQVNPHFLFNSLNVLSALVKRDPDAAEGFIQGLSEVYRYVLEVRGETLVTLARELQALDAYARLVTMRFGAERLRVEIRVEPRDDRHVVPLALQMLIENAIKHNGATRRTPLVVEVLAEAGHLVVRNNRVALFEPAEGTSLGLANIAERYRLATGREVTVETTPDTFTVKLPL